MELNQFIKAALTQVVEGIISANEHFDKNAIDAAANPANVHPMLEEHNKQI